jgi:predicted ArsR family transcriptional regulator
VSSPFCNKDVIKSPDACIETEIVVGELVVTVPTRTSERLLLLLKTRGAMTTRALAERLGISVPAVRQQLVALGDEVTVTVRRSGVGRPAQVWSLAPIAAARFPDTHSDLKVELIDVIESTLGEAALDRIIVERSQRIRARYVRELDACPTLEDRLERLVALRSEEGYLAELESTGQGWLLIENHCPICAAAERCRGFCANELQLFRDALGTGAHVVREDYLLAGARRCAYRVTPVGDDARLIGA